MIQGREFSHVSCLPLSSEELSPFVYLKRVKQCGNYVFLSVLPIFSLKMFYLDNEKYVLKSAIANRVFGVNCSNAR